MTNNTGDAREINLGEDFGEVIVLANGMNVRVHADGNADIYTDGAVKVHPAIDALRKTTATADSRPEIGDVMPAGDKNAGWIYAGISKTTNAPFYAAPKDSGVFKWNEAMKFAAKEQARAPSKEELNQLYKARTKGALKGTFNVSGSNPGGWYWSATENRGAYCAWVQCFDDGFRGWDLKVGQSSLRLVRS